jgi:hypothetical protein
MAAGRGLGTFFGDDWEDALDSIKSVPGAFGNIMLGAIRQVRPLDVAVFALVVAGWGWFVFGYMVAGDHRVGLLVLALLPTVLWLAAGAAGAIVFEVSGIGPRVLSYWESYVLILACSVLGVVTLRLALNPKDQRVYRAPETPPSTSDA